MKVLHLLRRILGVVEPTMCSTNSEAEIRTVNVEAKIQDKP